MARYDWETIRAEFETGATMGELSRRYGVSKAAISKRAGAEGWVQDVSGVVNRRAEAKVNGLVNTVNPKKKAEAIERAADAQAAVRLRHREEWALHGVLCARVMEKAGDGRTPPAEVFEYAKLSKIIAETLKIRQDGERKAHGISDKVEMEPAVPVRAEVRLDLSGQSPQDVAELARAAFREEADALGGGETA